jgi:type I restriction enzyme, S subunit
VSGDENEVRSPNLPSTALGADDSARPAGWEFVRLEDVVGITGRPRGLARREVVPYVPMSMISTEGTPINDWEMRPAEEATSGTYFEDGDVLLARITPCLENGKQGIVSGVPGGWGMATTEVYPLRSTAMSADYLAWLLRSPAVHTRLVERMEGATGRMRLAKETLLSTLVPLPPRAEQDRIVRAIDEALEGIHSGSATATRARAALRALSLSTTRDLLSGALPSLSAQARTDLHDSRREPLNALSKIQYGWTAKANKERVGPRMLRITDIQNDQVNWESVPFCEIDGDSFGQYRLHPGDVVFARTGATTGKSFLIRNDVPQAVFASYLIRVSAKQDLLRPAFLALFFQSADYWAHIANSSRGIGQPNVNGKILGELLVPVPGPETQDEVLALAGELARQQASAVRALNRLERFADTLRLAVLRDAFAGQLVPQDRSDEPAIALLDRIRSERTVPPEMRRKWKSARPA